MIAALTPSNEKARLQALQRYAVLDTPAEADFDEIVELASMTLDVPIALVSLIDADRQWFKARVGLAACETHRDIAFCAHAIHKREVMVVSDTLQDERFADNPLVLNDPHIRFYAGAPLITDDGFALGTLCAIDRSPKLPTAQQLRALQILANQVVHQLELRRTHGQVSAYARQLEEAVQTKDRLLSLMSHDLKSPFTALLGFSDMLLQRGASLSAERLQEMYRGLRDSAGRALKLVENLLEWASMETGKASFVAGDLSLDAIFAQVVAVLELSFLNKNIRLIRDAPSGLKVYGDERMLSSVLQNLLGNALKFTPSGGEIRLQARALDEDWLEIQVRDCGVGMSPQQLENLFKVGVARSTTGTGGERGTGFGLLLCAQFIERHGGDIQVSSQPGNGTEFRVRLPRHAPAV